ncbi:unnamed protein product, partial [Vitis vinifera]
MIRWKKLREHTILTNPMVTGSLSSGSIGYGPLAVGPRRLAYGASPVVVSNYVNHFCKIISLQMGVWLRQSKWNIVYQKQHRREREDGIDINGENGNIAAKYFLKELKRKMLSNQTLGVAVSKRMISPAERHHLLILEVEVQMHQAQNPLWAIYASRR